MRRTLDGQRMLKKELDYPPIHSISLVHRLHADFLEGEQALHL